MGQLLNSEDRIQNRKLKKLGFPYPCKRLHREKHNIIGDIPINELSGVDYDSMLDSASIELHTEIQNERSIISQKLGASLTYYEIRDSHFLSKKYTPIEKGESPGRIYAFIFGDYDVEFKKCMNNDEAKETSIKLALKRGESISRAYKQLSRGGWKRVRVVA